MTRLKGFPEGTTHVLGLTGYTYAGGTIRFDMLCFKYVESVLMCYTTDSDNENPGWIEASRRFDRTPEIVPLEETAVLVEREACAKVAETDLMRHQIAAAIRARGQE